MAVMPQRRPGTAGWVRREVRIRACDNVPAEPAHRVLEAPNCRACVSKHSTSHVDVLDAPNDGYAAVKVNSLDRRRLVDGEEIGSASATERRSGTFGVDSRIGGTWPQRRRVTPAGVQASTYHAARQYVIR